MIDLIIDFVSLLQNLMYYTFYISFKIGNVIIHVIEATWILVSNIGRLLYTVLSVVFEDFGVFMHDFVERLCVIVGFVISGIDSVFTFIVSINGTVKSAFDALQWLVLTTYLEVVSVGHKIITAVTQVCAGIKYLFVLFGSGMWFAITLLPVTILYLGMVCTYYIGRLVEELMNVVTFLVYEVQTFVLDIKQFFTDVPMEATLGFVFTGCIVYVISKCYLSILEYVHKTATRLLRYVGEHCLALGRLSVKAFVRSKRQIVEEDKKDDSNFCIICQERQKCVLLLPCKHLCVCDECHRRMRRYERRCPVCRTNVEKTMKVFV